MMHIRSIKIAALVAGISIIGLSACSRGPQTSSYFNSDDNGGYASDASRIEWANNDVVSMADAAGNTYSAQFIADSVSGVTVATDTVSVPHTLTIRFGETDVTCLDGRKRSGTITIQYSGEYTDSAQPHTITFTNYSINDNPLTGTVTVQRVDTTVTGQWYYNEHVSLSMNVAGGSQTVLWQGSLVRRWVSGALTNDRSDDVFSISGQTNLTRGNGNLYSFGISSPLQVAMDCNFIQAGVANVNGTSGVRVLNYGSGTCDNLAQVTLGQDNSVHNITLTP